MCVFATIHTRTEFYLYPPAPPLLLPPKQEDYLRKMISDVCVHLHVMPSQESRQRGENQRRHRKAKVVIP